MGKLATHSVPPLLRSLRVSLAGVAFTQTSDARARWGRCTRRKSETWLEMTDCQVQVCRCISNAATATLTALQRRNVNTNHTKLVNFMFNSELLAPKTVGT
ncbi:uncharacterized protein LOC122322519 [Drosophila grimshawi]|uniref:uncharacterized protein LOC122322519 n=1 Tax=Drosophila grimshawi TaxID=7222 RepID=UPI001C934B5F|nr:uncharacterized protein LOC122322519 [Drosophila grimshawi]